MFSTKLRGMRVWLNAPFDRLAEFLEYYRQEKAADPCNTSACVVVPCWRATLAECRHLLAGMHVLREYPRGTRLFWAKDASGERRLLPPCPFAVRVYYDTPAVRPVQLLQRRQLKDVVNELLRPLGAGEPEITMQAHGTFCGMLARVLFDSGATGQFVSSAFVRRAGLRVSGSPADVGRVEACDGREVAVVGTAAGRLQIGSYAERLSLDVLDISDAYDVILGNSWLLPRLGLLDYKQRRVCVHVQQRRVCFPVVPCGARAGAGGAGWSPADGCVPPATPAGLAATGEGAAPEAAARCSSAGCAHPAEQGCGTAHVPSSTAGRRLPPDAAGGVGQDVDDTVGGVPLMDLPRREVAGA